MWLPCLTDWVTWRILEKPFFQPNREKASSNITYLITRCKFFFLFIGREFTTRPVNNCGQIMVCSCTMSSNCVWPHKWAKWEGSHLISVWHSCPFPKIFITKKICNRMIKQLLNSVMAKYRDLSVSRRSIICLSRWPVTWQISIFCSTSSNNFQ